MRGRLRSRRDGDGLRVSGFISEPDSTRSNRNMENFFINGRYVKSRTAAAALEQAYATRIPSDKFPFCVLNIELNPAAVDVNVHPSKLEVKFSNERLVFEAVYYAVRGALEAVSTRPEFVLPSAPPPAKPASAAADAAPQPKKNFWVSDEEARALLGAFVPAGPQPVNSQKSQMHIASPGMAAAASHAPAPPQPAAAGASESAPAAPPAETEPSDIPAPAPESSPDAPSDAPAPDTPPVPPYIIIGEAYNCYVIVQLEDRLILIDKHAAHERILFDQMCENLRGRKKNAQMLMFPLEIPMTEPEIQALEDLRERVEALGFVFRRTRSGVSVSGIPTEIARDAAPDMLTTLAGRIADGTGTAESTAEQFFEARLFQASCKAAIKGGRLYSPENIRWLCDRILCVPEAGGSAVKTCPHGRPVAFEIRKNSIERQFFRLS